MSELTSAADVAAHLGTTSGAARVILARDSTAMPAVVLEWDAAGATLRLRAVIDLGALGVERAEPNALALAIATINVSLEVLGLELDRELAFVTHAFIVDGSVPSATLDRLLESVDACEERTLDVLTPLRSS